MFEKLIKSIVKDMPIEKIKKIKPYQYHGQKCSIYIDDERILIGNEDDIILLLMEENVSMPSLVDFM